MLETIFNLFLFCLLPQETALNKLMAEIQNTFKGLGLLIPYCWKKGEACVVRGSDTVWYRAKIVEVSGSTLQVSLIVWGREGVCISAYVCLKKR